MQQKRRSDEQFQGKALSNSDFPSRSATTRPLGVFILSDVRLCREGLELILARRLNIETVGSASSLNAIGEIVERRPDVVLLDASVADARVLARKICDVMPDTKIIAFALFEIDEEVIACAEAGIIAYIAREGSAEDLIDIVYQAIRGDFVCSPRLTGSLFRHIAALSSERTRSNSATIPEGDDGDHNLTRREKDIIPLITQGMSNKEIARHLSVGASTIKNHIHNILEKLRLRRRGEIVAQLRLAEISHSRSFRVGPESSFVRTKLS